MQDGTAHEHTTYQRTAHAPCTHPFAHGVWKNGVLLCRMERECKSPDNTLANRPGRGSEAQPVGRPFSSHSTILSYLRFSSSAVPSSAPGTCTMLSRRMRARSSGVHPSSDLSAASRMY